MRQVENCRYICRTHWQNKSKHSSLSVLGWLMIYNSKVGERGVTLPLSAACSTEENDISPHWCKVGEACKIKQSNVTLRSVRYT